MHIPIRFIISLAFILIAIFPFFLHANSCNFPDLDACKITDTAKIYEITYENVTIKNDSYLEIDTLIFSKELLNLDISNSTLNVNRILPNTTSYKLNISLDNSFFTFRNANSIVIETLIFKDTDTTKSSVFVVQGFSNVDINELITDTGSKSVFKIKSTSSTVNLKKASINDLYFTFGYLRVREGGTYIDNIYNIDPDDTPAEPTPPASNGYINLNKGGRIEILEKGNLTIGNVEASQLHVINGTVNINGKYNFDLIDNLKSDTDEESMSEEDKNADKVLNIEKGASGMVSVIKVKDLNLKGQMTVQNSGNIENLNYAKDSNGNYIGTPEGILIFDGKKVPDENGQIKDEDPTPTLTLSHTYLEELQLNDGDIDILNNDSEIRNIKNPTGLGTVNIEYVNSMKSDNVQVTNLNLVSTKYYVSDKFEVKNLKMTISSEVLLDKGTTLDFESLEMGNNTKIIVANDGELNINVSKKLTISSTMLKLNNLNIMGTSEYIATLSISVDGNLRDENPANFNSGVNATGNITLANTNIVADIQNTSMFNLSTDHSYNVMHADGVIAYDYYTSTNATTNLPEWFSSDFQLENDGKDLVVNVKREKSYTELLAMSNNSGDQNTQNIAESLDKMVEDQSFTNDVAGVISNIDLKSDINNIGLNLASLKPIDNNVYIHDIHANANSSLEMLLQNSSYSYLKTKNTESDILWVRNGVKKGKLNPTEFSDGNKYTSYFAMAGFDIFAVENKSSYFQLGVAGGFNFSDINANHGSYDINSVGYNVALYSNFITDYFTFSLNSIYLNNIYDSQRYSVGYSKTTSTNNVSELLTNVEVSTKFTVLDIIYYDSKILKTLGVNNLLVRPSVFYTNGYITGNSVVEQGMAGYNLGSYSTMIHDTGVGVLLYSTNDNAASEATILQGSYIPYMEVKTFYRIYDVPDTVIGFIGMPEYYDINIVGDNKDELVFKTSLGLDYEKDSHILGIKYSYEYGFENYSEHGFYLNYKFLLN